MPHFLFKEVSMRFYNWKTALKYELKMCYLIGYLSISLSIEKHLSPYLIKTLFSFLRFLPLFVKFNF